ncbi:MAG: glycosyltransferase family 2 protein [Fibromonadales bacterium]|nr:glycosyltransferase family 2 protein [Fibromonadales bacterium]
MLNKIIRKLASNKKKHLSKKIENGNFPVLLSEKAKNPRFIISLTTYGKRTAETAPYAIWSLFNQNILPDKIVLYLDKENWNENNIPLLLKKEVEHGLEIRFRKDIRAYTKLNHALEDFPSNILITADDDVYYPENWLELLLETHKKNPQKICCHRAHIVCKDKPYNQWKWRATSENDSSKLFPTGVGGVLYPPNALATEHLAEAMVLSPLNDDITYWALAKIKGTNHCVVKNGYSKLKKVNGLDEEDSLSAINVIQSANDQQMNAILEKFSILLK